MVLEEFLMEIVIIIIGLLLTSLVGLISYLGMEKLNHMEGKIDEANENACEVKVKLNKAERDRKKEHDVVLRWLINMTRLLNKEVEGVEVEVPDEVDTIRDIDVNRGD